LIPIHKDDYLLTIIWTTRKYLRSNLNRFHGTNLSQLHTKALRKAEYSDFCIFAKFEMFRVQKCTFWGQTHLFWVVSCFAKFITRNIPYIRNILHQYQIFNFTKKSFQLEFRLEYLITSSECRALLRSYM